MEQSSFGAGETVFRPRRKRQTWLCVLWLVLVAIFALVARYSATHEARPSSTRFYAIFFLVLAVLQLAALLRGVPRLTIGPGGVALRSLFRTKAIAWADLGPFALTSDHSRRTKRLRIVASMVRASAMPGVAQRSFIITDAFETPLREIMACLGRSQGRTDAELQNLQVEGPPEARFGVLGFRWPWLTTGLVATIIVVFVMEQAFAVAPPLQTWTPSVSTLVAFGGLSRTLAQSGEWWRLLTAPFLHASLVHLLANGVTLAFAGYALERFAGRFWTLCIFVTGALAGSAGSFVFNAPDTVTVGSSGAIMAMVVAVFVMSFHLPAGRMKTRMQSYSVRVGIPSLIPVAQTAATMHVDYGAHAGGALYGGLLALLMLVTWKASSPLPSFRTLAAAVGVAGAVSCGLSAYAAAREYQARYVALGPLIPAALFPKPAEIVARANALLAAYPDDPRSYLLVAVARLDAGNDAEAERLLGVAVVKAEAQQWRIRPSFVTDLHAELAEVLLKEGRKPEAEAIARQACSATGPATLTPAMHSQLTRTHLCPDPA